RQSNVVPIRRRITLPAVATFAVAAAAAAIVLAVWASSLSTSLDRKKAAIAVLADPRAEHMTLGTSNQLLVAPDGPAALLSGISRAPAGQTSELWVISRGDALPAGLFSEGKSGSPVLLARRVPKGGQVGLSLERAGGAKHPTTIISVSKPT